MTRISLIEEKDHPELRELIAKIRSDRGGRLLNLYEVLLHSPAVAMAFLEQVTAVRWKTQLDGQTREIVTIRIGILNRCGYVFKAHVPAYTAPEGLTREQCDGLADWRNCTLFDARQRAALAYTDAMTRDIQVPDAVYAALRPHFSERQIVELTVLIGTYNMHTRVLQALDIDPTIGRAPEQKKGASI
ncbi:MAG: carboxymuconolactone decarboxylase family protein [Betaproteobacteria bacterium]|nr:carboxymuconolactone decarboxylase family protein [Betaproteobacteria bacterium]